METDTSRGKSYARAYFFDVRGNQIGYAKPFPEHYDKGHKASELPFFLLHRKPIKVRFPISETMRKNYPHWRAIVVFGDETDATGLLVAEPNTDISGEFAGGYNFDKRELCARDSAARKKEDARLTEIYCTTGLPDYPRITMFARLPEGVKSGANVRGILCLSLLANRVEDMRLALERNEAKGEFAEMLEFADRQKLLVICWGSRNLWDASRNWNELSRDVAQKTDLRFNRVATAWETGINRFGKIYDFTPQNMMLCGFSASAQYAMRLAMRKPQYFGAVFIHIPSSFDKPTKAAANVLWCLATGELESGYARSQNFYKECRKMGYRVIYKAVPGLGHQEHKPSMLLGLSFLEYAQGLPKDKKEREIILKKQIDTPSYWGDWLNQGVEANEENSFIPVALRVALPTRELATAWEMKPIAHSALYRTPAMVMAPPKAAPPPVAEKANDKPPAPAANAGGSSLFGTRIQE